MMMDIPWCMGYFGGVSVLKPWCEYNCENPFYVSGVGQATLLSVSCEDLGSSPVWRGHWLGEAHIGN